MTRASADDRVIEIKALESPPPDRSLAPVPDAPEPDDAPAGGGGLWAVAVGAMVAVLWIAGSAAYVIGYAGVETIAQGSPAQIAGLAFVVFSPALLIVLAGLMIRQMMMFSRQARLVETAAMRLTRPDAEAERRTRRLADALTGEVGRVNTGMDAAIARLGAMEEVIRHHGDSLSSATTDAESRSRALIQDLRAERDALASLADTLDARAKAVADAIAEQSGMVVRAAELAQTAAAEGREQIETGASALQEASGAVRGDSEAAAKAFTAQREELNALSAGFSEHSATLKKLYDAHRDEMESTDQALREEQKRIASALDFHRAELRELVKVASRGADELSEATRSGGESLRAAADEAVARARSFTESMSGHTEQLGQLQRERLRALDEAAEKVRLSTEAAYAAMDIQASSIKDQVEQLGESTYDSATRAEQVLERRLSEAAKAVDKVSRLADEADEALAERFERSLEAWGSRIEELKTRLGGMSANLEQFPGAAEKNVREVETVFQAGVEALREAARNAAEEAKEIDTALQARMRHNYELLSDFVLRMGTVSGGPGQQDMRMPPLGRSADAAEKAPPPAPAAPEPALPVNPRSAPRAARSAGAPRADFDLGWRDIVSSLRETEFDDGSDDAPARPGAQPEPAPAPAPAAAEPFRADPAELSRTAARDAAHARRSAGIAAMREVVCDFAPEHVEELAGRIEGDPALRGRVADDVGGMEAEISAAVQDDDPESLIELMCSRRGRTYLLLSAALGDA